MTKTIYTANDYEFTNQGDPSLGQYDLDLYQSEENRVRLTLDTTELADFLVAAHNLAYQRLQWLKTNTPDAKVEILALAEALHL